MIRNLIFYIGYFYFILILKTCKSRIIGREIVEYDFAHGKPMVFCCPHNFLLGLFAGVEIGKLQRPRVTLVASMSRDGELISKLLKKFRFDMVRGSSNRGGKNAMRNLTKAAKQGQCLGLSFDGPKGPPLVPKRGLMGCARATGGSLYLIYGYAKPSQFFKFLKPFRVNSWDKFLIPVPFCSLEIYFEKVPEYVPLVENLNDSDSSSFEKEKEEFILNYIETRSKEIYGFLYS